MEELYYKGALIDENHKTKNQLFFVNELFIGDFKKKAPISLREKITPEVIDTLELHLACYYRIPLHGKSTFKSYKHFMVTLEDAMFDLKKYVKQ